MKAKSNSFTGDLAAEPYRLMFRPAKCPVRYRSRIAGTLLRCRFRTYLALYRIKMLSRVLRR